MNNDQSNGLPATRKEQFFDCLQYHYDLLLKVGLLLFFFFLPLILAEVFQDMNAAAFYDELLQKKIDEEEYRTLMLMSRRMTGLYRIAGTLLLSIGAAGCINVIKHLCWQDPVSFSDCFRAGVKGNCKTSFVVFAVFGLFRFLVEILRDSALVAFCIPAAVILACVFFPIMMLMLCIETIYNASFAEILRNSSLLFFSTFFKTLFAVLVCFCPILLFSLHNFAIKYLMIAFVIIVILPVGILGWFLYCLTLFDRFINDSYPELKRRGLN